MLADIKARQPELRRSEAKVAAAVLQAPEQALDCSIAQLAQLAEVSPPTVVRFCRALGYSGFRAFKLALAQALGRAEQRLRYAERELNASHGTADLIAQVIDGAVANLLALRRQLDPRALQAAVRRLHAARRVEFYALGGNSAIAADAQLKFNRLGVYALAYCDAYLHGVAARLLGSGDVVVAISNTGRSADLLTSVESAKRCGAAVIAVTAARSPLAALADITLATQAGERERDEAADEAGDGYAPIKARIAPMLVIDALAVGLVLAGGAAVNDRLSALRSPLPGKFLDT